MGLYIPLESVLLAMIHSRFVYSIPLSHHLPSFPIFLRFSIQPKKIDQQNEMYKWQLCWCKGMQAGGPNVWSHTFAQLESLGWSEKFANSLTGSLWYHNGCMWRGWWDSKAGSCCSWPTPPTLVPFDLDVSVTLCAYSMPKHAQFFYLSFSSYIIQFFTFPEGVSFWVIWRK